jgi:subtilisin family serine protease
MHTIPDNGAGSTPATALDLRSLTSTDLRLEFFSSAGAAPILFDRTGHRLATPIQRDGVDIVAPDGTNNKVMGTDIEGDGFPNLFGTSAAAPHAAGVAALLLDARPNATSDDVYAALETTAIDMDDPYTVAVDAWYDEATGWGLIQADQAIQHLLGAFS